MLSAADIVARLRADEGGWTLIEMLVATVAGIALLSVATMTFTTGLKSQPRLTERANDVQQARTTVERITRELRQGWSVPTASPAQLSILTYVQSATCGGATSNSSRACRVTYTCSSASCSRVEANPDGTSAGAAETVASRFTGPNVFTYSPSSADADYVGVRISYPAGPGEDAITLEDGVALRNPGAPQ
jgi:type II secretory pathway pseudopilin PulG